VLTEERESRIIGREFQKIVMNVTIFEDEVADRGDLCGGDGAQDVDFDPTQGTPKSRVSQRVWKPCSTK
jgi:hypothetical protein